MNDDGSNLMPLPKLGNIASPALEEAVVQLVASKHACDQLARRHNPLAGVAGYDVGLWQNSYYIPEGFTFFREFFPFTQSESTERGVSALAPTRRTIGDAHRRYPEAMPPEQLEASLAFLQHPDRSVWGNKECATYTWIRPLGLFLAGEGKNRVSLFQRSGVEWIPACVSTADYPSPERIVLHMSTHAGTPQCWAVLDGRMAEYLPNPIWAQPVLEAYGVKVISGWPDEYPPLSEVVRAHDEVAIEQPGRRPQVDLEAIRARATWENERVRVSPLSQLTLKSSWKYVVAWLFVVLTSGWILARIPSAWTGVRLIASSLLGATMAIFIVMQIEFIPMRRRDIQLPLGYRAWLRQYRSTASGSALAD